MRAGTVDVHVTVVAALVQLRPSAARTVKARTGARATTLARAAFRRAACRCAR